jgi:hypothetical protein
MRKNKDCKLQANSWYHVHLILSEKSIKVMLGTNEQNLKEVLDYEGDLPLEGGPVGFLTYGQRAGFTDIEIVPASDYEETKAEEEHSDEEPNADKNGPEDQEAKRESDSDFAPEEAEGSGSNPEDAEGSGSEA